MPPQLELKEDDTLPKLTDTLDTVRSATGASVTLILQPRGSDSLIVNDTGTITDDTAGATVVEYQLSASQTANTGVHRGEWVVDYGGGDVETFPKDGHFLVTFDPQLNRGGTVVTPETTGRAGPIDVLLLNELASAPSNPAVDDSLLYVDDEGFLRVVDENGDLGNMAATEFTTGEVTTTNKGVWVWHDGKLLDFIAESDHADIGAAFSSAKSTYGLKDIRYVVPAGDYGTVSNTVDLANVGSVNAMVDFSGVRFTFDSAGDPIFDFTNSHNSIVLDLRGAEFDGDSTNVPSCGLLFARPSGGGSAGNHQVYGGTFDGHYSAAPLYNIGGEVMNFYGCQFYNKNTSGRAAGFTGAENPDSVTSPSGATATAGSASTNQFWGCSFNGSGPATSLVIGQGSVFMTSFYRCQINGGTDSFIRFKADGGDINHVGFFMCHGESGSNTPSEVIDSTGPGSGQNAIKGIQFPTANFSGATNFLDLADNLQMVDWKIGTFARAGGFIVPGGVTINDDDSFAVNWSFINLEITGSWSFPNGGSMQNSILFGSLSNLGIDPAHSLVFDLGSDSIWGMSGVNSSVWNFQSKYIAEKDGAKTYLGARTSTPHTASGTGDVYIDVSQNPPKWQIDDPTDSAWEDM